MSEKKKPKLKRTRIAASDGELRYMPSEIREILESEDPSEDQLDRARGAAQRDVDEVKQNLGVAEKTLEIVKAEIKARALAKKGKSEYKDKDGYVVGLFEVD